VTIEVRAGQHAAARGNHFAPLGHLRVSVVKVNTNSVTGLQNFFLALGPNTGYVLLVH
jgi:hypothetical protein